MSGGWEHISQAFGLSWAGLGVALAVMLPNLVFAVRSSGTVPEGLTGSGRFVGTAEQAARIGLLAALILQREDGYGSPVLLVIGLLCLFGYYAMWIRFFRRNLPYASLFTDRCFGIPLPLAVFPLLHFLFMAAWLTNPLALVFAALFAWFHLWNSQAIRQQVGEGRP
jgi:ABC-type Na+ efflux pump permease subunit